MEMCLHWRRIIFGAIDSIKLGGKKREFNVASNVSRALVLCRRVVQSRLIVECTRVLRVGIQ